MSSKTENKRKRCPNGTVRNHLGDCKTRISILIQTLKSRFKELGQWMYYTEELYLNITRNREKSGKKKVIRTLKKIQTFCQKNIFTPLNRFLKLKQFHTTTSNTQLWNPTDIMAVLKKFENSSNKNDLSPLNKMVQNLEKKIDIYIEKNIVNVNQLVVDENASNYSAYPQWNDLEE